MKRSRCGLSLGVPVFLILAAFSAGAPALPLRLITSVELDNWSQVFPSDKSRQAWLFEEAAIIKLAPRLSLIAKANYSTPAASLPGAGGSLGAAWDFGGGFYSDLVYKGFVESGKAAFSNYLESSVNYENAFLYAGMRERAAMGAESFALVSSAFAKWSPLGWLGLWASYSLIYERGTGFDNSLWSYVELRPAPQLRLSLGGSLASFHLSNPITTLTRGLAASLSASAALWPLESLGVKYQFEYFLGDRDWNKTAHSLVVDLGLR